MKINTIKAKTQQTITRTEVTAKNTPELKGFRFEGLEGESNRVDFAAKNPAQTEIKANHFI